MIIGAVFVTLLARWMAGWYVGGRLPTLAAFVPRRDNTGLQNQTISVVIPARNEAHSLPALLRSLANQTVPPREVIVVDDQSTDTTSEVAARAGVTVLSSAPIPRGWLGKPWACAQGAAHASSHILVFLDADTVAGPGLLARLKDAVAQTSGLISVAPYHQIERPYEAVSALFNLVSLMGVGATSLNPSARVTGAFGPCIAVRLRDYVAVGGHGAVRSELLEDVALARAFQVRKLAVVNLAGAAHLRYRMYPDGPSQLIEGWSKNFAAGAQGTPRPRLAMIVAWLSGLIEAGVMTVIAPAWPHVIFYALYALQLKFLLRRIGNYSWIAWLHPVAVFALLAICVRSVLLQMRGSVTWKGRAIAIHARHRR